LEENLETLHSLGAKSNVSDHEEDLEHSPKKEVYSILFFTINQAQQQSEGEEKEQGVIEEKLLKKIRRKGAKERREEIENKENELGTQETIEITLGTGLRNNENLGTSTPSFGGKQKPLGKYEHSLL